jgi:hypothetical protein
MSSRPHAGRALVAAMLFALSACAAAPPPVKAHLGAIEQSYDLRDPGAFSAG